MTESKETKPNILVILSDQHNKGFLGCSGNSLVRTPHLDRLAAEGMRFTNAYCASPLCVPSRMSFMTSRTPSRNQVWDNTHSLSSGIPTWAHYLGAGGYETALIGRMHFVGPDQRHGFELRPFGDISNAYPGAVLPGGQMWTTYGDASCGQNREGVEIAGKGTTMYQWYDEQVTEKACAYLRAKVKRSDRPFTAVVGHLLPHCPFIAPKELFEYYYERVDIPNVEDEQPQTITRFRKDRGILRPPLSQEQTRVARAAYYALCEYYDSLVGKILTCLDESGASTALVNGSNKQA